MENKETSISQLEDKIYAGLKGLPVSEIDYDCLMEGGVSVHISWDTDDPYFLKLYQDYYGVPFDDEE